MHKSLIENKNVKLKISVFSSKMNLFIYTEEVIKYIKEILRFQTN
jgi:hypothetical protein